MPNWVENEMIITANKQTLNNLFNKIETVEKEDTTYYDIARSLYPLPNPIALVFGTGKDLQYVVDKKTGMKRELSVDEYFQTKDNKNVDYDLVKLTEEQINTLKEEYGAADWYDWNCNNYGTKWGDVRTECPINDPEKLVFTFDSAWSNSSVLASRIANDYKCDVLLNHYSIENWEQGIKLMKKELKKNKNISKIYLTTISKIYPKELDILQNIFNNFYNILL